MRLWAGTALTCLSLTALAMVTEAQLSATAEDERRIATELLSEIHASDLTEITVGNLARSKGTTPEIRNFGVLLIRDHTDFDRRVQELAKKQDIQLADPKPTTPEEEQRMELVKRGLSQLESLDGPKFDTFFFEFDGEAHRVLLRTLITGNQQLKPSAVKALITKIVPILRQHESLCRWCWNHCLNSKP